MSVNKKDFVKFLIDSNVLTFGEFTLKSGRISPYFLNFGVINSGWKINTLGKYYADIIKEKTPNASIVFGPAYKGIPICVAAAGAYDSKNIDFCFDRKEVKDHGDGGIFVGKAPKKGDNIVIVDDVITSGKAFTEVYDKLKVTGANINALFISVDRGEAAKDSEKSAIQNIEDNFSVKVYSIISIYDITKYLDENHNEKSSALIKKYLETYGVKK